MSGYPRIEAYKGRIRDNCTRTVELCRSYGIDVMAVTKGFCAYPEIAKCLVESGVVALADSRIANLKKLQHFDVDKVLLRIPMPSELDEVIEYADLVLVSEIETARVLGQKAKQRGTIQRVMAMVDIGDLREGFWLEEIVPAFGEMLGIKGIEVTGIGTNLSCYGGVIPRRENLGVLVGYAKEIEKRYGVHLDMVSGGNSSSMHLVFDGGIPEGINNLRIGEAILLGRETVFGIERENYHNDTFVLKAEIVEIKEKPSVPIGEIGRDAFGNVPVFTDRGVRKRAIIAVGKQDIQPDTLVPYDKDIIILGGSSDHTILDISDCDKDYSVGDILAFDLTYGGMLGGMTSPYVEKVFVE
ncbi:MAG: ornithine racemase Orr [Bacillota bacterium]|nr:ornithine racemase Orr [Bacillota bacterium]MDD3298909.1 ornithine racemase Orr [Bacillota bacterium]MDD3851153.1 ornithine racemase Orr [Bacillota bacterium]MDD4707898.1 ornithine racemase Orr [Bacillota bacterium]